MTIIRNGLHPMWKLRLHKQTVLKLVLAACSYVMSSEQFDGLHFPTESLYSPLSLLWSLWMYGLSFHGNSSRVSGSVHADSVVDRGVERETRCAGSAVEVSEKCWTGIRDTAPQEGVNETSRFVCIEEPCFVCMFLLIFQMPYIPKWTSIMRSLFLSLQ